MIEHWHALRQRFGRRPPGEKLSAFIDGELDPLHREDVAAQAALDPAVQRQLQEFRRLDALLDEALRPARLPDPMGCAEAVLGGDVTPWPSRAPGHWRVPAAIVASVGLLLTAGLTFAGLRRRGLV